MYTKNSETYDILTVRPAAFTGGTAGTRGDDGGASDPLTLLTVTGVVAMKLFGVCSVDLASAGGGTLSVGTALSTAGLIALTTATAIDAGEIWHDATPDASIELSSVAAEKIVTQDVKEYIATADITAGQVYYVCMWRPLSLGATVTVA